MSHKDAKAKRAKAKKDTGIAVLPNSLLIAEETRDALQKRDWTHAPEKVYDPNNPDNWTIRECQDHSFTGFRYNELRGMMELWCLGILEENIPKEICTPEAMASAHERVFATRGTLIAIPIPEKPL